jgi:hypothetical protein
MRKNFFVVFLFSLLLIISLSAVCWASPSGLVVVRASDGSLWKATCNGTTCSSFTSFPGNFNSQPTVYWDEDIAQYVIWGRASDSSIWRATFDRAGAFNNNWASIPGSTPSPIGGAGGGIVNTFGGSGQSHASVTLSTTTSNVESLTGVEAPFSGYFLCTATAQALIGRSSTSGTSWARFYIVDSSGTAGNTWTVAGVPSGTPTGNTYMPMAFQRWFSTTAGTHNFYLTADTGGDGTHTITVWDAMLSCQFHPYAY